MSSAGPLAGALGSPLCGLSTRLLGLPHTMAAWFREASQTWKLKSLDLESLRRHCCCVLHSKPVTGLPGFKESGNNLTSPGWSSRCAQDGGCRAIFAHWHCSLAGQCPHRMTFTCCPGLVCKVKPKWVENLANGPECAPARRCLGLCWVR